MHSLVILRKQLGDTLLLEPALSAIAAESASRVGLMSRPAFAPMVSLMDNVVPVSGYPRPGTFREIISFDPKPSISLIALGSFGAHRRLVLPSAKHLTLWHRLIYGRHCVVVRNPQEYWAKYYFNRVIAAGTRVFRPPVLNHPPEKWRPDAAPTEYFVLHPTSAWRQKCWPHDRWVTVCRKVLKETRLKLVITGGSSQWEQNICAMIEAGLNSNHVVNLAGKTSLPQYLSLLAGARLVLAVDGSASHLAAAFARPILSLFGPTNPAHWHYPTETSLRLWAGDYSDEKKPGTEFIPTEDVLAKTLALLEKSTSVDFA